MDTGSYDRRVSEVKTPKRRTGSHKTNAESFEERVTAAEEANETGYWLELLFKTNYINENQYKELGTICAGLRAMLVASINTAKENIK